MQGRNRNADIEIRHVGVRREGAGGMKWETMLDRNTLLYAKQRASGNLLYSTRSSARHFVMT